MDLWHNKNSWWRHLTAQEMRKHSEWCGENPFAKAVPSDKCGSQGKTKMPLEIDETGLVMIKWNDVWICPLHCSHIEKKMLSSVGKI